MDPVGTGRGHVSDFLAELGEVGGEDGGGDADRQRHVELSLVKMLAADLAVCGATGN
jgi:hypothetical protein